MNQKTHILQAGFWKDEGEIRSNWAMDRKFASLFAAEKREAMYGGWKKAVEKSRAWTCLLISTITMTAGPIGK